MRDVVDATTAFDEDPATGAIVVTGSERAFAAGADIAEMANLGYAEVVAQDLFAGWDGDVHWRSGVSKGSRNVAFEISLGEGVRFERRTFHATFATEDKGRDDGVPRRAAGQSSVTTEGAG